MPAAESCAWSRARASPKRRRATSASIIHAVAAIASASAGPPSRVATLAAACIAAAATAGSPAATIAFAASRAAWHVARSRERYSATQGSGVADHDSARCSSDREPSACAAATAQPVSVDIGVEGLSGGAAASTPGVWRSRLGLYGASPGGDSRTVWIAGGRLRACRDRPAVGLLGALAAAPPRPPAAAASMLTRRGWAAPPTLRGHKSVPSPLLPPLAVGPPPPLPPPPALGTCRLAMGDDGIDAGLPPPLRLRRTGGSGDGGLGAAARAPSCPATATATAASCSVHRASKNVLSSANSSGYDRPASPAAASPGVATARAAAAPCTLADVLASPRSDRDRNDFATIAAPMVDSCCSFASRALEADSCMATLSAGSASTSRSSGAGGSLLETARMLPSAGRVLLDGAAPPMPPPPASLSGLIVAPSPPSESLALLLAAAPGTQPSSPLARSPPPSTPPPELSRPAPAPRVDACDASIASGVLPGVVSAAPPCSDTTLLSGLWLLTGRAAASALAAASSTPARWCSSRKSSRDDSTRERRGTSIGGSRSGSPRSGELFGVDASCSASCAAASACAACSASTSRTSDAADESSVAASPPTEPPPPPPPPPPGAVPAAASAASAALCATRSSLRSIFSAVSSSPSSMTHPASVSVESTHVGDVWRNERVSASRAATIVVTASPWRRCCTCTRASASRGSAVAGCASGRKDSRCAEHLTSHSSAAPRFPCAWYASPAASSTEPTSRRGTGDESAAAWRTSMSSAAVVAATGEPAPSVTHTVARPSASSAAWSCGSVRSKRSQHTRQIDSAMRALPASWVASCEEARRASEPGRGGTRGSCGRLTTPCAPCRRP
eukprot:362909-Chlamydomonas_euryale.AAC.1